MEVARYAVTPEIHAIRSLTQNTSLVSKENFSLPISVATLNYCQPESSVAGRSFTVFNSAARLHRSILFGT
jgi:hypothetical protein